MSLLDYLVLFGTMIGIAAYGTWQTRGVHSLSGYFKGDQTTRWAAIGISVMATQASAISSHFSPSSIASINPASSARAAAQPSASTATPRFDPLAPRPSFSPAISRALAMT